MFSKHILPYEFRTIEQIAKARTKEYYYLRDFQNNGSFYKFGLIKQPEHNYYYINILKPDGKYIDQHNFKGKVQNNHISFHDWNRDGIEELFVFSTKLDTIFLSIIDIINKKKYLNEKVIISGSLTKKQEWDLYAASTKLIDVNNDGKLDLVIGLKTGLAKYPRGIFTFDIDKKELINKYLFNAGFYKMILFDVDKDGEKEIVVPTTAYGNIPKNNKLTKLFKHNDLSSWLLIFDKKLNLKFPAKKFGSYPSSIDAKPYEWDNEGNNLLINTIHVQTENSGIYLFNKNLELIKFLYIKDLLSTFLLKDKQNRIVVNTYRESYLLDNQLNIIKKLNIESYLYYYGNIKLDNNSSGFLFKTKDNKLLILDYNFKIIGKVDINELIIFQQKHPIIYKNNKLNFNTPKHFYRMEVIESNFYKLIPYLSILSSALFFLLFFYANKLSEVLYRRSKGYKFLITRNNKALVTLNHIGLIKSYNDFFVELISNPAFLKKNTFYGHFITDKPELKKFIDNSIKSNKKRTKKITTTINNELKNIIITVYPIISFWGYPISYVIEIDDITDPINVERQKIWAQTSRKIAHEIKTPLSTIQLNLKALNQRIDKDNIPDKDNYKDDLNMISTEVGRISELTKSFLQFASLEKAELKKVNVKEIIENSLLKFRTYFNNNIDLITTFPDEDIFIYADVKQLGQLFHILIENSIDSIKQNGIVEIKINLSKDLKFKPLVEIEIIDNGTGISKKELDKIFDPYFTTKKHGNGLGLAIAKKIVEDNNGKISFYSKKGLGTTVTVNFEMEYDNEG